MTMSVVWGHSIVDSLQHNRTCSNSGSRKAYSGVWAKAETDVGDEETAGELIHTTCMHTQHPVLNLPSLTYRTVTYHNT